MRERNAETKGAASDFVSFFVLCQIRATIQDERKNEKFGEFCENEEDRGKCARWYHFIHLRGMNIQTDHGIYATTVKHDVVSESRLK